MLTLARAAARLRLLRFPLFAVLLALAAPAAARAPSDVETKALSDTVARFDAAMQASDFDAISQTIPPKVMQHIATSAGISVEDLHKVLVQQMQSTLAAVKIESFSMDLGQALTKELPDGTPFLLLPTETVIDTGDGKVAARSHTLALLDGGAWYLLRVSDEAQVKILRQVYPGFAAETFPAGTTEVVQ